MTHGTRYGYKRHLQLSQEACPACRAVHAAAIAEWRNANLERVNARRRQVYADGGWRRAKELRIMRERA